MKEVGAPSDPGASSRHERGVERRREHAAKLRGAEGGPRIDAGHRIFLHERGEPLFGPGVCDLLVRVDETGSLHQAAKSMGMSYSKAWRVMREAERHLGVDLLQRQAGGPDGGGSVLTEDGRQLMLRFRAFADEADAELDRLYRKHFGDLPYAQPTGPPAGEAAPGS